jgi:hypothetical protein
MRPTDQELKSITKEEPMKNIRSAILMTLMGLVVFSLISVQSGSPALAQTMGPELIAASQFPNDIIGETYVPSLYYATVELVAVSQFPGDIMGEAYVPSLYYEIADYAGAGNLVAIDNFPYHLAGECYCPPLYYEALVLVQQ